MGSLKVEEFKSIRVEEQRIRLMIHYELPRASARGK